MLKQSSIKPVIAFLAASVFASGAAGCRSTPVREIQLGEWIGLMVSEAGISGEISEVPFYFNIDESSLYFEAVQSAVSWGILEPETAPDLSEPLNREWAAYTLVNLASVPADGSASFRDCSAAEFPGHISAAVSAGMMKTDRRGRFHPKEIMDRDEACLLLDETIRYMNHRRQENTETGILELQEEISGEMPQSFDPAEGYAVFAPGSGIVQGSVFATGNDDMPYAAAAEVSENQNGELIVQYEEAGAEDVISDLDLSGSFDLDFSAAQITDLLDPETSPESSCSDPAFSLMSMRPLTKSTEIYGWKVSYGITPSGIRASAAKTSASGILVSAEASLSGVHPVYEWHMNGGEIDSAYFRIDCVTSESLSARRSCRKILRADGRKIRPEDFMNSLKAAFSDTEDTADISVPLCTIRVPVPQMPLISIVCRIELHLSADGKAELSLSQNHSLGMEIRNGMMRPIHDTERKSGAVMNASASMTSGISFGMEAQKLRLCDCAMEAGVRGTLISAVHMYDENNRHSQLTTSIPADLVAECAEAADSVLVCSDIHGGWILNLNLNSPDSFAGKMGFSASVPVLNESSAPLFPGMKTHMENFHFVDHCTRGSRQMPLKKEEVPESEQIEIASYALFGNAGETQRIAVTRLPDGYSLSSLIFESDDPLTVSADSSGTLTLHREGSAVITVSTADRKYQIRCTVTVRHEERNAADADHRNTVHHA